VPHEIYRRSLAPWRPAAVTSAAPSKRARKPDRI
jgi:hypothetical protein